MIFSSSVFLFIFLPIFMITVFSVGKRFRNLFLVIASLLFYAWGEPKYIFLLIISIFVNYLFSFFIDSSQRNEKQTRVRLWLSLALVFNLALLVGFKYTGFLASPWNWVGAFSGFSFIHLNVPQLPLPLGISFFTFSAISYLIDIYRKDAQHERNPIYVALYISFFPKLLAGPIVQYRQIKDQITNRSISTDKLAGGIQRFIVGLGGKVLIANTLGAAVDQIFAISPAQLTAPISWLGIICYTLQIYFDFSGYSHMAIGIGKMAGFDFPENFRYPYISQSIREFWQRWHISLSTWFRDYLYIPLGGNRRSSIRVYFNLMTVFMLCGLWHGAGKTFIVWGAWHGIFIVLEHAGFGNILKKIWSPLRHLYLLLIVIIGWVIFRSDSLHYAAGYLKAMFGLSPGNAPVLAVGSYLNSLVVLTLLVGIAISSPFIPKVNILKDNFINVIRSKKSRLYQVFGLSWSLGELLCLVVILVVSIMSLSGALNNPFIYFKF